ncbi:MAG: hypothetical protein R2697_10385 [Ilumatobacteraceae bacterium]
MTRAALALIAFCSFLLLGPEVVHADAAGPTDYTTEIVAISPATDVIDVEILGGDAFVGLTVEPGHEVIVLGYAPDAEPYLRFGADGVVEQNVHSYATYYNDTRYGTSDIPDVVDVDAEPAWEHVADGGTYVARSCAHWMSDEPLLGLEPGDALPVADIPLVVDGVPTTVTVETTLQPAPSRLPALVGGLLGAALGLVALVVGRATATLVALLLSVAALVAGLAQYTSLPATTGPEADWWLYPAVALLSTVAVIVLYRRSPWAEIGLLTLAGMQLLIWAWPRRDHATAAYLPTSLPADADRVVAMMVLVGSVFVIAAAVNALVTTARDTDA